MRTGKFNRPSQAKLLDFNFKFEISNDRFGRAIGHASSSDDAFFRRDAVTFQQSVELATVNAKYSSGPGLVAILLSENVNDMSLLEVFQSR
jgi:hypothetical protein